MIMHARNLLLTFLPCTLSATLPSHLPIPPTTPKLSLLNLTTTTLFCFDPPHPRTWIYSAHLPDCQRAAAAIIRNIDPFTAVTFSQAPGSGFRLPADYRYKSCWIYLNIDPGDMARFQPQVAYIGAWELARECTSGMYQFGRRRTVGPGDKVVVYINGEYVPGMGEEEGLVDVGVGNGTANVDANE